MSSSPPMRAFLLIFLASDFPETDTTLLLGIVICCDAGHMLHAQAYIGRVTIW